MTEPTRPCGTCGMPCTPGEYHPYAACLMFKACHNSGTVRANLEAVRGTPPAVAGEPVGEFDQMRGRLVILEGAPMFKHRQKVYTTPQPTQAQAGAVPLTESEMGEGWRKFQETLDDRIAADPAGVRNMGREHWLSWAHWKAACNFALGIKGGQHG